MASQQTIGRQCIMDQARRLFFAHGYHGVSIRNIVQACDMSNAALYYHFDNKRQLFIEVVRDFIAYGVQRVQEAGAIAGTCRQRLTRMAEVHVQVLLESSAEIRSLERDLVSIAGEELRDLIPVLSDQGPRQYAGVFEEGVASGELRALEVPKVSALFAAMITSIAARRYVAGSEEPLRTEVERVVAVLFEGIAA